MSPGFGRPCMVMRCTQEGSRIFHPDTEAWGRLLELVVCDEHDDVLRHGDAAWEYDDQDFVIRMGDDAHPKLGDWEIEQSVGYTVVRLSLEAHGGARTSMAFRIDPEDARALGMWLGGSSAEPR